MPKPVQFTPTAEVKDLLDPDEILRAEFAYASETSLQANNDRAQVVNLFLVLVGGVGSIALALTQFAPEDQIQLPPTLYAIVFFIIGLLGLFTILKLIRLRQAWYDSLLAMNRIKDFYLAHYPAMAPAFRWRTESIPQPELLGTITFNLSVLVALIDSISVGGGMFFINLRYPIPFAIGATLIFLVFQGWLYFQLLSKNQ